MRLRATRSSLVVVLLGLALWLGGCSRSTSEDPVTGGTRTSTPPDSLALTDPGRSETVAPVNLVPLTGGPDLSPAPRVVDGLEQLAVADESGFALFTEGGTVTFLTGINVGAAIPARLPAELKITPETWRRWFPMIAGTGVHAIRVYTMQPPHFYDELRRYNLAHPDRPLYLVHGVWIPEEDLFESRDLFDPEVLALTFTDIDDAVNALHGNATLPTRQGYASGTYTSDVSDWLVSWAFGIEMDPTVVRDSDAVNVEQRYEGTYVSAKDAASPTEVWLARMLDRIAGIEAGYGRTMPLTFSNWPTTDPLDHPTEPLFSEDLVGIDANNLDISPSWPGGLYASYHAYPYYPDFQRYEPGIADYQYNGRADAYAGYLVKLRDHHAEAGLPTMVLEFGLPSSLGSAHDGSLGRGQGGHSEQAAMAFNADMLRTQQDLGLSGGFLFAWQDEWFKRTWNTLDLEVPPDRRQLWQNPLTNEANFGLLAIEPGENGPPFVIDGNDDDWLVDNSQVILEAATGVREVRARHDESYLYLRLIVDEPDMWLTRPVAIGFDVVPGGNGGLPGSPGVAPGADTAIVFGPGAEAAAFIRASNDYNDLLLGRRREFYEVDPASVEEGSGVWNPQRLSINLPLSVPTLGLELPMEWHDLNPLPRGTSDPASVAFDARTIWAAEGFVIEIRVPWAIVGLADPSSRAGVAMTPDGVVGTAEVERLAITMAVDGVEQETAGYSWEPWNRVTWSERPKAGLGAVLEAVEEVNGLGWVPGG